MSHRLGFFSTPSRDAQVLHHVNLILVRTRACEAAHGLNRTGQSLDGARCQNRPCSDNLNSR